MQGICGIVALADVPIPPHWLDTLASALNPSLRYRVRKWCTSDCALAETIVDVSTEAEAETLAHPIVARARLDRRQQLIEQLRSATGGAPAITDAELVRSAVQQWRTQAWRKLDGDWSFASWDVSARTLQLCRDHCGTNAVFYSRSSEFFFFASTLKAVLACSSVSRQVDEEYIAKVLCALPRSSDATAFRAVKQLLPGHQLRLDVGDVAIERYWAPADVATIAMTATDCVDGFRAAMTDAVNSRTPQHTDAAILLSGGLDSGAVAWFAARSTRARGHQLRAYSHVPKYVSHLSRPADDERVLIRANAAAAGITALELHDSESVTPLDGINRSLDALVGPIHTAGNMFWFLDICRQLQLAGLETVFAAVGGNYTISWPGGRTSSTRWNAAGIRHRIVRSQLLSGVRSRILHRRSRGVIERFSAIDRRFAERVRLDDLITATNSTASPNAERHARLGMSFSALPDYAASFGLTIVDPTLDLEVVRFCLSVPEEFFSADGQRRLLVKRAMRGLMSAEVLGNTERGGQGGDLIARFRRLTPEVEAILSRRTFLEATGGIIDLAKMAQAWKIVNRRSDRAAYLRCVALLARGLMVGLFLERELVRQGNDD